MSKKQRKPRKFEGLPVVDSNKKLKLTISANDVKGSKMNDPANCVAARACKTVFGKEARVFMSKTYIKDNNKWIRYQTPEAIQKEIIAFDRGAAFIPGDYQLNAISPSNRLGTHRGHGGASEKNKNKLKRPYHVTANVRESARTYSGSK